MDDGPDKYLQYVVCSGAQYVDTDYAPDQDTKTEVVFTPSVLTGMRCLFCSRTASAYYDFFITTTTPGARIDYGQVQQTASPRFTPADTEHPVACVMDGPRTSIDGWCYYSADPSTSFTLARPIYLLCAYSFDSINTLSSYCSGRLHSCRIWDGNGNMQRDLLPAERDGVVGLWDAQNLVTSPAAWFVLRADSAKAVQALRLWTYYGGQSSGGGYWVRYRSAVVEYTTDEIAWPATTTCTSGSRTFNVVEKDAVPAVEWKPVTTGYESFETATPFLPVVDLVFPKRLRNVKYIRVSGIANFSVKELQLRTLPKRGLMLIVR